MSAPWFSLSLNLENEVFGHCIVFLEKTRQVLILGGTRENVRLKEIWIYDLDEYNMPRSASDFNGHVIGQKPKKVQICFMPGQNLAVQHSNMMKMK